MKIQLSNRVPNVLKYKSNPPQDYSTRLLVKYNKKPKSVLLKQQEEVKLKKKQVSSSSPSSSSAPASSSASSSTPSYPIANVSSARAKKAKRA
ncbi:hypothetical protein BGW41_007509 [Actinomortierella wolfii]|nr:hypothetical protein BGW41_007509 [Actinomortierella wolfii]